MSVDGWEACPHCGEEYSVGDHPCLAAAWARCLELERRLRAVLEAQGARSDAEDRERVEESAAWRAKADVADGWRASYEAQKRNTLAYLADAEALAAKLTLAEAEVERLRALFDATRHRVLRSMGVADMGASWIWIEATLAAQRRSVV